MLWSAVRDGFRWRSADGCNAERRLDEGRPAAAVPTAAVV